MIKVIYFDLGGVVVTDGFFRSAPLFAKESGLDEYSIASAYIKTDDWRYSAGKVGKQRWEKMFDVLNAKVDVKKYMDIWHSTYIPIPKTIEIIKLLNKNYTLGVLADQPKDMMAHLNKYSFFKLFKLRVISCEIGHSKEEPGNEIFKIAIRKAKVIPEEILFIDNKQSNLDKANSFGIKTILFKNPEKLKKDLKKFL